MTQTLQDLETPCLIADRGRIEANAARMLERVSQHNVSLRPHVKTVKSSDIATIAHGNSVGPVTVSTLNEAEYFFERGFRDITYAVALSPNKFNHAYELTARGADLKVLISDVSTARAMAKFAGPQETTIKTMLEIDSGEHRTGFAPGSAKLAETAKIVADAPALDLVGLLTHGGHSYRCTTIEEIAEVAEQERRTLLEANRRLNEIGIDAAVLSSGSTPTALHGRNYDGISEIRPGVYLAGDLFQSQIETCALHDIAISVLATVIAQDREREHLVIDAGALALSKDRSTRNSPVDYGYGLLVQADGEQFETTMVVSGVHQEHGEVTSPAPLPFDALPVGSQVRVLPNHACMTAAAYERFFVTDGGTDIVTTWDKACGW